MNFKKYKFLILSDLYRVAGNTKKVSFIKYILLKDSSFTYNFWMRTSLYAKENKFLKYTLYPLSRFILTHLAYKYGISVPYNTKIGSGFFIGHFGGIVVNRRSIIGKNCNISQGVTLGEANRGKNKGYPILGNNVYIGPGAKIVGGVKIGDNVAIGANCVVTKDIPDNAVVVGIPGRVISDKGSNGYINLTDYEDKIRQQL